MKISFNDLSDISSEDGCSDHDHTPSDQQLVVLPPAVAAETGSCSGFMLPDDDWIVKAVPRTHSTQVDKYYCNSKTGRKFRSRKEVERYLKGEVVLSERPRYSKYIKPKFIRGRGSKRSRYSKYIMRGGKAIKLDGDERNEKQLSIVKSNVTAGMSISDLPDGWIIEKVPRRLSGFDKYYLEPGTGLKFRSLVEVKRHLGEDVPLSNYIEEIKENKHPSMAFNISHKKKDVSGKIIQTESCDGNDPSSTSSFQRPCNKEVKWILSSSGGDFWHPFSVEIPVSDCVKWVQVPGCVKQEWNQRFMAVMNGAN